MATALTITQAKEVYIEGAFDLLLFLKKVFQQALDDTYSPEQLPQELAPAYNQLVILLNNSISGLRLPSEMTRNMLNDIRSVLKDYNKSHLQTLVNQLQAATDSYISLANTEQQIITIQKKYSNASNNPTLFKTTSAATIMQMRNAVNTALAKLIKTLEKTADIFKDTPIETALQTMINNIISQRAHMIKAGNFSSHDLSIEQQVASHQPSSHG